MRNRSFASGIKRIIIIVAVFSGIVNKISAGTSDVIADSAIAAYSREEYELSLERFTEIHQQGYSSPALLYNIACAYFKTGDLARSILFYERALRLNPGDEDILLSLKIANTRIPDKIDSISSFFIVSWFNSIRNLLPVDTWALISIVFSFLLFIGLFLFIFSGPVYRKMLAIVLPLIFLLAVSSLTFAWSSYKNLSSSKYAIIMKSVVNGKSSPTENSTDIFVIHEGLKVQCLETIADWTLVRLPDGKKAWIKSDAFEII